MQRRFRALFLRRGRTGIWQADTRGALTGPGSRLGGQALANKTTTFLKSAAQCQVLEASSDTDSDASVRVSHALPMA